MKKITLLLGLLVVSLGNYAQDQTPQLEELLERYQEIPTNGNSLNFYFSIEEIAVLQSYFSSEEENTQINTETRGSDTIIFGNNSGANSFISFNTNTPGIINFIGGNSGSTDFESAGDIDPTNLDRAYALTLSSGEFYEVDITTATYTFLGILTAPGVEQWNGLEFDPETNILYGISSNFIDSSTLSIIDIPNLTATPIGLTGMTGAIAIVTDGAGNFYSYDVIDDSFYSINSTTGQATLIGFIGFDANFGQDLEWDPTTQTMYMTAFNATTSNGELRTVDLTTGDTTFIGLIDGGNQVPWASIPTVSTLTIDDPILTNFNIFPNPAKDNISIMNNTPIERVVIYNSVGQQLMEKEINTLTDILTIDTLHSGVYFIKAFINDQVITRRLIKN